MTESEWLVCKSPSLMLRHLIATTSDRKVRLYDCACVRRVWYALNDERLKQVVIGMEEFTEGLISAHELEELHNVAWEIEGNEQTPGDAQGMAYELGMASRLNPPGGRLQRPPVGSYNGRNSAALAATRPGGPEEFMHRRDVEENKQAVLVRDIFDNPFRPIGFLSEWRTSEVISLAKTMYETRDFSPMAILADALNDAGCESADLLDHCRGPGLHVRGCWVVDLVLGKE